MTTTELKCPSCGAKLSIEGERESCFCTYCGTKVIISNENEHIYRHVDEAELKRAETEQLVKLKELDLKEKGIEKSENNIKLKILASIILGSISILFFIIGCVMGIQRAGILIFIGLIILILAIGVWVFDFSLATLGVNPGNSYDGKIRIPDNILRYTFLNYDVVETSLRSAGFTNIKCIPLNDLTNGLIIKPNRVQSVTVNGRDIVYGSRYSPDSQILITYHTFQSKQ